ncbi:uncharacterized protein E0L32_010615 [Thyridium curvatum]|uniref:CFEM domain-containing protein n=1 Tax=Thyridium curvatum TaxID=1093900 RepID=A0A507AS62_9PEZI|nr:uncharacterized protein E0L32_010615 [Thyridium curvatum]TPX07719.1 hypothetical protein E0L32_010615 [Thyridium curvatum]
MKFTLASAVAYLAVLVKAQLPDGDIPGCAATCFLQVYMSNSAILANCKEDNMYLCFCKSNYLPLAYQSCVCSTCPAADKAAALQYGKDTCELNGAPIDWIGASC